MKDVQAGKLENLSNMLLSDTQEALILGILSLKVYKAECLQILEFILAALLCSMFIDKCFLNFSNMLVFICTRLNVFNLANKYRRIMNYKEN